MWRGKALDRRIKAVGKGNSLKGLGSELSYGLVAMLFIAMLVWWMVPNRSEVTEWRQYLERPCEVESAPQYGEFFFDDLARMEPEMFKVVASACSSCPGAPACQPLEAVMQWRSFEFSKPVKERGLPDE